MSTRPALAPVVVAAALVVDRRRQEVSLRAEEAAAVEVEVVWPAVPDQVVVVVVAAEAALEAAGVEAGVEAELSPGLPLLAELSPGHPLTPELPHQIARQVARSFTKCSLGFVALVFLAARLELRQHSCSKIKEPFFVAA